MDREGERKGEGWRGDGGRKGEGWREGDGGGKEGGGMEGGREGQREGGKEGRQDGELQLNSDVKSVSILTTTVEPLLKDTPEMRTPP